MGEPTSPSDASAGASGDEPNSCRVGYARSLVPSAGKFAGAFAGHDCGEGEAFSDGVQEQNGRRKGRTDSLNVNIKGMRNLSDNVRGAIVKECGHFVNEEKPAELSRLTLEFFAEP